MTKDQLQKELKEKVKPGVKPSHLKRSKSLNDLPSQESEEIFVDAPEENAEELKQKITQLEDQILELRISKLKDFGDYLEKKQTLKAELESNVNYGVKEIERLETKLKTINRKKLELEQKLGQSQSEKARLEIKLINAENKEENITPTPNWWIDYGPIILMVGLYFLSIWLLNKNAKYNNNYGN
ncbi:protein of unknown function [endosymbiont DhMRE of Dentiscutata heterogama]|uniref:hypothetical protein n=1 Tax=endosymbiont DhMRE of Dentiscutata heterogama TaxID=1609546 RepID=UPI000629D624|nr:hypothetical protein [endosymbiont DhMRE of Dentiscutata heterogama]CFW93061.1 protein of unknown function [endosymbiont DhMRE of Dentiscutata heterogama]